MKITWPSKPFRKQKMPKRNKNRKRNGTRTRAVGRVRDGMDSRPATFNKTILSLIVDYDVDFTADVSHGFGFSPSALWVNGVSTTTITGASEIAACFDLVRIQKVEVTLLPGNNVLSFGNTVTTGQRNIPYLYHCIDYNSGDNPSLNAIRQQPTCIVDSFDHVIRRTIYPRPSMDQSSGANGLTNLSADPRIFTSVSSDIPAYGIKIYADLFNTPLTYDIARFSFKIFYECVMGR